MLEVRRGSGKINDDKRTANTAFRMKCKNNDESRGTQQGALFLQDKRQSGQRRTWSLDKKQGIAGNSRADVEGNSGYGIQHKAKSA